MNNSRPLKFRVWNPETNSFIREAGSRRYAISLDGGLYSGLYDLAIRDKFIVQQFTGLKDSSGVEIYEGDIVDCHYTDENIVGEIKYSEEFAAFLIGDNALWQGWLGESRVISNIFENHELLK